MKREDDCRSTGTGPKLVPLEVVDEIPNQGGKDVGSQKPKGTQGRGARAGGMRFLLSLGVAALADGLEVLFPFAWVPIDLATVGAFFLLWGFRWEVALVLIPELIPGVNTFPSWVMLALYFGNTTPRTRPPS